MSRCIREQIKKLLIKHYLSKEQIPHLIKEGKAIKLSLKDEFIDLKLVYDDHKFKNQHIQIQDLLEDIGKDKIQSSKSIGVIIKGGPGAGKSTLMDKVAYDWAAKQNQKLEAQQTTRKQRRSFEYVFRINLKTLMSKGSQLSLQKRNFSHSLFFSMGETFSQLQLQDFVNTIGKILKEVPRQKILILLDGFDEIRSYEGSDKNGQFLQGIMKLVSPYNTIITSRPQAVQESNLLQNYQRIVEVQELEQRSIYKFVDIIFGKDQMHRIKKESLLQAVKKNRSLLKIMQSPLNLTMVSILVINDPSTKVQAQFLDQNYLYNRIIRLLVQRFQFDKNIKSDQDKIDTKKKINEGIYTEIAPLKKLKELISEAFFRGKITIHQQEIRKKCNKNDQQFYQVINFGLLKLKSHKETELRSSQTQGYYHQYEFIHLSFAEYLVAQRMIQELRTNSHHHSKDVHNPNSIDYEKVAIFIAQKRYESTYFNILRYLAMLCKSQYAKNKMPLQTLWVCLTCNIEGTLEFGKEKRLRLFLEMMKLSQIKDAPKQMEQARLFIENTFDWKVKQAQSKQQKQDRQRNLELFIRWHRYFIDSSYFPSFCCSSLIQKVEELITIYSSSDCLQQKNASDFAEKLLIAFCQIMSNLIYLVSNRQGNIPKRTIDIFIYLINSTQQDFIGTHRVALSTMKKLLMYLSEEQFKGVLENKKKNLIEMLLNILQKQTNNQALQLLTYCAYRQYSSFSQSKVLKVFMDRLYQRINKALQNQQDAQERRLLRIVFTDQIYEINSQLVQIQRDKIRDVFLKDLSQRWRDDYRDNSDEKRTNKWIKVKMFSLLSFICENQQTLKERNIYDVWQEMDDKNTQFECKIGSNFQKDRYRLVRYQRISLIGDNLKKVIKERTKNRFEMNYNFYLNLEIPTGYGKFIKANCILGLIQQFQEKQREKQRQIQKEKSYMRGGVLVLKAPFAQGAYEAYGSYSTTYQTYKNSGTYGAHRNYQDYGNAERDKDQQLDQLIKIVNHICVSLDGNVFDLKTISQTLIEMILDVKNNKLQQIVKYPAIISCLSQEYSNSIIQKILILTQKESKEYLLKLLSLLISKLSPGCLQLTIQKITSLLSSASINNGLYDNMMVFLSRAVPQLQDQAFNFIIQKFVSILRDNQDYRRKGVKGAINLFAISIGRLSLQFLALIISQIFHLLEFYYSNGYLQNTLQFLTAAIPLLQQKQVNQLSLEIIPHLSNILLRQKVVVCLSAAIPKLSAKFLKQTVKEIIPFISNSNLDNLRLSSLQFLFLAIHNMSQQLSASIIQIVISLLCKQGINERQSALVFMSTFSSMFPQKYLTDIIKHSLGFLDDKSMKIRQAAVQFLMTITPKLSDQYFNLAIQKIVPIIDSNLNDLRQSAVSFLQTALPMLQNESLISIVNKIIPLLCDTNWSVRQIALILISKAVPKLSQPSFNSILSNILPLLSDYQWSRRYTALQFLSAAFLYLPRQSLISVIQKIIGLLNDKDWSVRQSGVKLISKVIPELSQESVPYILKFVIPLLSDNNKNIRSDTVQCLQIAYPKLSGENVDSICLKIHPLLQDKQQSVSLKVICLLSMAIDKVSNISSIQIYKTLASLLQKSKNKVLLDSILGFFSKIAPRLSQQFLNSIIKMTVPWISPNCYILKSILSFLSVAFPFFQTKVNFILQIVQKIIVAFISSDNQDPIKTNTFILQLLNKMLPTIELKMLSIQLFSDRMIELTSIPLDNNQILKQVKILNVIRQLKRLKFNQIQKFTRMIFANRWILMREYKQIGEEIKKDSSMIHIVIMQIQYYKQDFVGQNYKVLVQLAKSHKKVYEAVLDIHKITVESIYQQVKSEGIQSSLTFRNIRKQLHNKQLDIHSLFTQELLKKLFVLCIEDNVMSSADAQFIQFCIQSDISVTFKQNQLSQHKFIHRFKHKYSILFSDQQYPIYDGHSHYFRLIRSLFQQTANNYAKHKPLFKNEGKHGLRKAAIDVRQVTEVFLDNDKISLKMEPNLLIDWDQGKVLHFHSDKDNFYVLMRRDQFGQITARKIQPNYELLKQQQHQSKKELQIKQKNKMEEIKAEDMTDVSQRQEYILSLDDINQTQCFKEQIIGKIQNVSYCLKVYHVQIGQLYNQLPQTTQDLLEIIKDLKPVVANVPKWKLLGLRCLPLQYLAENIEDIGDILQRCGSAKYSKLKKQLLSLGRTKEEKQKINDYYITALWKLYYIIEGFGLIQTKMFQANKEFRVQEQLKWHDITSNILSMISQFTGLLPIFGEYVNKVLDFTTKQIEKRADTEMKNIRTAFRHIFEERSDLNDRKILIQQVILQLVKKRFHLIVDNKEKINNQPYVLNKIEDLKNYKLKLENFFVQQSLKTSMESKKSSILAVHDVITLIISIVNNKEEILKKQLPRQQIPQVLINYFYIQSHQEELTQKEGCFPRFKNCLKLYESCCCCKHPSTQQQLAGLSWCQQFKKYFLACFCCCECSISNKIHQAVQIETQRSMVGNKQIKQEVYEERIKSQYRQFRVTESLTRIQAQGQ